MLSFTTKNRKLRECLGESEKQVRAWEEIAEKWEDTRETSDIIKDIVNSRSEGREFSL